MSFQGWDDILQEGAFGGVKFDFVSVRDDHSADLDHQKFPGVQGGKIVDRGRNSVRFDILAVIIEDDYPSKVYDLSAQLEGGVVRKFVHPIFGELYAACERFTVTHDADEAADSATIQITLIESLTNNAVGPRVITTSAPAKANALQAIATQVLVALSAFQAASEIQNNDYVLAVTGAVNAATSIRESLEATAADLSSLAIQATVNGGLAKIETAVVLGSDYETTEQYNLAAAILDMGNALRDLAQALLEARPPLSTFTVVADTNLLAWCHDNGQDPDEVIALNSLPDPSLIPAGFRVLAYAE